MVKSQCPLVIKKKTKKPNTNPTVHAFALITTFIRIPVYIGIRGICNRNKNNSVNHITGKLL